MPIMALHVTLVCDITGYELATHEAPVDDLGLKRTRVMLGASVLA